MSQQFRWMFHFRINDTEPISVLRVTPIPDDVIYTAILDVFARQLKVIVDAHDLESAVRQAKTVLAEMPQSMGDDDGS